MRIFKIFLYDEPTVPEIQIIRQRKFLENTFKVQVEIRDNIFKNIDVKKATNLASCRIFDLKNSFTYHEPKPEEIELEERWSITNLENKDIFYDGFEMKKVLEDWIPLNEQESSIMHVIFTNKLVCTFDTIDSRYHGRALIASNPSIISTTGIVEAPARPREYYIELMTSPMTGINTSMLNEKYKGEFLEYHDKRTSKIIEGYLLQSVFYHLTAEPFCKYSECRLFNSHWQKELLETQIEKNQLCKLHKKILEELVNNLNP